MLGGQTLTSLLILAGLANSLPAQNHDHHGMAMDATGMVMNANESTLPRGCQSISRDHEFTVRAGTDHAVDDPGMIFGMSAHEWHVEPCSRVTVTFINEDQVRHQWMIHGLPSYLYPRGMFHLEAAGGHRQTGTFIVPSDDRTYLVHCDMAQHMEKGMKGQLVVGEGSGNLTSIPGISGSVTYSPRGDGTGAWLAAGVMAGLLSVMIFGIMGRGKKV